MSVLKKIRDNVGLVIGIIALSLFAFIFSSVYDNFGPSQDNTIGEVNGSDIDYQAYDGKFELAQRNNPNASTTAEQYQLKEQAWQSLVREAYYSREWAEAGIGVSDDELMMMFTGKIYHPYVQQSGYFADSLGQYNPGMVPLVFQRADEIDINDPRTDPNWVKWKLGLLDLRNILSLDRQSNKWQSAIKGSALVSDNEIKVSYENQQRAADISYVYVPYASIADEQVTVTDADRNDYYNKHRESYRLTEEVARFKYTFFKIRPSAADSSKALADLNKLITEFRNSETAFQFAKTNSDDRTMDTVAKPLAELPAALSAIGGRTDTVVGPIVGTTGFQLLRVVKVEQDSANANVQLRHIFVQFQAQSKEDSTRAKGKADSLLGIVAADRTKFGQVVMESSDDQQSKMTGGDLGWRAENFAGDVFAAGLKSHKPGDLFVTSSAGGYHVVELQDRSNKMYSFATITREVHSGTETNDSIFKRASLFHGDVLAGGNMDSLTAKYPDAVTLSSGNVGPGTFTLPGVAAGRAVIAWAFNSDKDAITQKLIEAEDAFVIAKVEYKGARGYATMESQKETMEFEMAVRNAVKAKQIKAKLKGSDIQAIAASYGPGATTGTARDLHMSSSEVSGLGNEPKVVGRAFGLKQNAVSAPIAGNSGVFVVKLDGIREPAPLEDMIKMFTAQTLKQSKGEATVNALFQGMRENAEVIDQRYKAEKVL
ncbi:MAG: SurA N-terminal domain-containing protein [Bacteroidetes bacterium]|nr:SurA N-terminal domain-containing protein [Bacteroidota bacterium]MBL0016103.1 SurA N-terminal domain-containing protein [Bacteroidota bacterium]MBP6640019.1 SurA N-terminal domain-containing protein [Bacteroidia bacterium]